MKLTEFEGPRGRYYRAKYELKHPDIQPSADVWVIKLKQLLHQRRLYSAEQYAEQCPLFHTLFSIFENDSLHSGKHMLEAMLVTGEDFDIIAQKLEDPAIPDGLVVGLYHELFYNIRPYLQSVPMMYRYVVQPLTNCNGSQLPLGEIWKLLAYCGGMDVLEASGFGTRPLNAEDLAYLTQLGGYRNAAMMLKYITEGEEFAKENPIASGIVLGLAELGQNRGGGDIRDKFGFKRIENVGSSEYCHALTGLFRMVYDQSEPSQQIQTIEDKLISCKPTKIEVE